MSAPLKIAIAEPSAIIRAGLEALLKKVSCFRVHIVEIPSAELLFESLRIQKPDVLIINPTLPGCFTMQHLKEEAGCPKMKSIVLLYAAADNALLRHFDEQINIYDSADELNHKLERLCKEETNESTEDDDSQTLSVREKEIVVCVVKGMTNREIAESLFLSAHTVITHRRNIARKLQIHSASGLTIYAIVNKLVELSDIQQ